MAGNFIVVSNGIEENVEINTNREGWTRQVRDTVSNVVKLRCFSNLISVRGKVLFRERDIAPLRNQIVEMHTTYRPYNDEEIRLGLNRNADGSIRDTCSVLNLKGMGDDMDELETYVIKKVTKGLIDALVAPNFDRLGESELITTKRISASGGALKISLTSECNALGLGVGDYVEVVLKRGIPCDLHKKVGLNHVKEEELE